MLGLKSNKIRDVYHWFKNSLSSVPDKGERAAIADEIFLRMLDIDRAGRVIRGDDRISETGIVKLLKAQKRLNRGEPVQYITGVTTFHNHQIEVQPGVLIPRPETEGLVSLALKIIAGEQQLHPRKRNILDMGTGSGCIAISLSASLPGHRVAGCDTAEDTLQLARSNARKNGVEVDFFYCDILGDSQNTLYTCKWDYIISNPPYVMDSERKNMKRNVLEYEPEGALFVPDDDPLKFYRAIAGNAGRLLRPSGWLLFEINEAMGQACKHLLLSHNFCQVSIDQDLHGKDRYIAGKWDAGNSRKNRDANA